MPSPALLNVEQPTAPGRVWALRCLALLVVYALAGWLGLAFPHAGPSITPLWLPAGVALAALLRWGPGVWPGVALGAVAVALAQGHSPWLAGLLAAGNTVGPLLAARWLASRSFSLGLAQPRDLGLLWLAAAGAALLTAGNGTAWLVALGGLPPAQGWPAAAAGWLGDLLGFVVAGSVLLTLNRAALEQAFAAGRRAPTATLFAATLLATWAVFGAQVAPPLVLLPLAVLPHVLLCGLALRGSMAVASLAVLAVAVGAALGTARGVGPLQAATEVYALSDLVLLWAYVATLWAISLLVAVLAGERSRGETRSVLALESAGIGVAEWDLRGGPARISVRWRVLLGDPDGHLSATPAAWLERVHADDRDRLRESLQRLSAPANQACRHELRVHDGQGWRWFECHALVAERGAGGEPLRLVVSLADVSARRADEERQYLTASLFQHLHEGLLITDAELRVLDVNPTYSQIVGVSRQELLGKVPALLAPESARTQRGAMWASLRSAGTWRGDMVERRRNGEACTLQVTITAVPSPDGIARHHVLVVSDITEQRLQRERLERQALFDELTRLPNRTRLSEMLADAMAAADREGSLLAVCYLDLDHFKPVNDRFGHAAGDRLLVELAQRLRVALRSDALWSDAAARLGGDEFVLLLRAGTLDEARLAVERVLRVISQPYAIEAGAEAVNVTASVGATVYPLDRSDPDTLLRHADHAMYGAKQSGRNGYLFFDPENNRRTEERVLAIGRVQEALDVRELELYYQPKVDMRRGLVVGVEALLRWNHPEHGLLPPAQFLPLIEHTGLSAQVGDWVLEQALEQLAEWQRLGLDLSVSVNVSARHLQEPEFAQRLAELLARQQQPLGARLELEVLETAALVDVDYTSALLDRCRKLGVRFALDDFGTGYSTLTYLKRLPVDVLKIDRSFVRNMLDDAQDLAIVQGVIGLARTFGCTVIAEGVETPAQARLLIDMGCDFGQGHGIASPMPAAQVLAWARSFRGPFPIAAASNG